MGSVLSVHIREISGSGRLLVTGRLVTGSPITTHQAPVFGALQCLSVLNESSASAA